MTKHRDSLLSKVAELTEKLEQTNSKYRSLSCSTVSNEQFKESQRLVETKEKEIAKLTKTLESQSTLAKNLAIELAESRKKALTNLAEKLGVPVRTVDEMLRQGATDEMIERSLHAQKPKISENIPVFSFASKIPEQKDSNDRLTNLVAKVSNN